MKTNFQKSLKQIQSGISKSERTISELIKEKTEAIKNFDEQIEKILAKNNLVKRIKVPKVEIKIWKHKGKDVKIRINWRYLISTPFIYGMFLPSVVFHICIEVYHQVCFRLYSIPL
jgi:hypothetical protein